MNLPLKNQVILITGGGGFLAAHFARAIVAAGGVPVLADLDRAAAQRNAVAAGEAADPIGLDITDEAACRAAVSDLLARHGRLDALVNNAAIDPKFELADSGAPTAAFEEYPLEHWKRSLDVNLTGAFLITRAVAQHFRNTQRGLVVNIASMYGLVGPDQRLYSPDETLPPPRYKPVDYTVTKAGLHGLTRYLATYWAGTGLRANTLTFGGVRRGHDEGFLGRYAKRSPLGRMADPVEVEQPLVFLLSDGASYMNGANLVVDGGWTAW